VDAAAHESKEGMKLAYVAKAERHKTAPPAERFDLEKSLDAIQLQFKHCYAWASVELPRFYRATLPILGIKFQSTTTQVVEPSRLPTKTDRFIAPINARHKAWLLNDGRLKIVADK
jgi:hypothetical protein